jgi:hypothetical protein
MNVLEKLPLCEKITHGKSYLYILNSSQDISDLRFSFFTVHVYFTFLVGANFTVYSLVHREFEFIGISKLYIIVPKIKLFLFFNTV